MVIFPEGGRSPDGWGQKFRGGAAYLSIRCGVPVVPVHIEGTGTILPKGKNRPRPGRTQVTFGSPLRPAEDESSRRYAARIEAAVAALADEVSHDWYTARVRAHAGQSPDLGGPDTRRLAPRLGPRRPSTDPPRPPEDVHRPPLARRLNQPEIGVPGSAMRSSARQFRLHGWVRRGG